MSNSGLIILVLLSIVSMLFMLFNSDSGKVTKNTVSVYILILGILSIMKSNRGMIQALYLGLISVIIALVTLFSKKLDTKKVKIINVLGIAVSSIGTYYAYIQ